MYVYIPSPSLSLYIYIYYLDVRGGISGISPYKRGGEEMRDGS